MNDFHSQMRSELTRLVRDSRQAALINFVKFLVETIAECGISFGDFLEAIALYSEENQEISRQVVEYIEQAALYQVIRS